MRGPGASGAAQFSLDEVEAFAREWYRRLDEHVPADDVLPMLTEDGLEFHLPEGVLRGTNAFRTWYEGVIRIFFDEVHTLSRVEVGRTGDAAVEVVVNWQARRWQPPRPRSQWIGFDAYQRWVMARDGASGQPVIQRYVVNELRPMPGSPPL
jgi:hypothetical protein